MEWPPTKEHSHDPCLVVSTQPLSHYTLTDIHKLLETLILQVDSVLLSWWLWTLSKQGVHGDIAIAEFLDGTCHSFKVPPN